MNMVSSRTRILMKGTVIYDCTLPTFRALSYILLRRYAGSANSSAYPAARSDNHPTARDDNS